MEIKLKKLSIDNFKKVNHFEWDFNLKNWDIKGDNGTGKSTLFDAYNWLLFNKDSLNNSDFNIRKIDKDGSIDHDSIIKVEATFSINGVDRVFSKSQKEKSSISKETGNIVYSGNVNSYEIDGLNVKEKDFNQAIKEIVRNEEIFKVLSFLGYFNSLKDSEKHNLLLKLVNINIDEAFKNNKDYDLIKDLFFGDINQNKKELKQKINKIKSEMEASSVKAATLNNLKGEEIEVEKVNKRLSEVNEEIEKLLAEKNGIKNNDLMVSIHNEILKIEKEKGEAFKKYVEEKNEKERYLISKKSSIENLKLENEVKIKNFKKQVELNERLSHDLEVKLDDMRKQYREIRSRVFDGTHCSLCGQLLPEEQLNQALEKFNELRANDLKDNMIKGAELVKELEDIKKVNEDLINKINSLENQVYEEVEELTINEFDDSIFNKKILELQNKLKTENTLTDSSLIDRRIDVLKEKQNNFQQLLAKASQQEEINLKINLAIEEQKSLSSEYVLNQRKLNLFEEYIIKYNLLIQNEINNLFKITTFKLFETLGNGNIQECCIATFKGIEYNSLNRALKLNVDLDIISSLQNRFNLKTLVWVDNAECCNKFIQTDCQLIKLYVKEQEEKQLEFYEGE